MTTIVDSQTSFAANPTIVAAAIAAIIALLTFTAGKFYEFYVQQREYERNRAAAIVLFQMDMELRYDDLTKKEDEKYFNNEEYHQKMIDLIHSHAENKKKFRMYGVALPTTASTII